MAEWFEDWFDSEDYLTVYNHRNETDAAKLVKLIVETTKLPTGSRVLDAACGAGRHAILLSRVGYDVQGFDLSGNLLKIAEKDAADKKQKIRFTRGDLRSIHYEEKFDLITNLFTSFGYFESDEENFAFVRNAFDFLNDNGVYVLDYLNKPFLEANLVPSSERLINGVVIREQRELTGGRINKQITLLKPGTSKVFNESVKLYCFEDILEEFSRIGYKFETAFGNYEGESFDINSSERAIMIFRK